MTPYTPPNIILLHFTFSSNSLNENIHVPAKPLHTHVYMTCACCYNVRHSVNVSLQLRTFVVRVQPQETIARVRAQLLHILYELGRDRDQFRLRYNGEYLRDAYTCTDYNITDNALLKMIPVSAKAQVGTVDLAASLPRKTMVYVSFYIYRTCLDNCARALFLQKEVDAVCCTFVFFTTPTDVPVQVAFNCCHWVLMFSSSRIM